MPGGRFGVHFGPGKFVALADMKAIEPIDSAAPEFGIAVVTHAGEIWIASGFSRIVRDEQLAALRAALARERAR